jgi:nucleoside-diphosphate-sugar epimerase
MRVLVTGHLGYLGRPICQELSEAGHDVAGLDADLFKACTFQAALLPAAGRDVPAVAKDIRDIAQDDLQGFEAVVHLAGLSNDPLGDIDPALTHEINHQASLRLARLARAAGVRRLLLASTCSVYGARDGTLLDEDSALAPATAYARSKLAMERDIAPLASDSFCPVFLRSGTVYGLSPRIRFDLVINNLAAWACATGEVHLKSDGLAWRPVVHVRDVARAFAAILVAPADKLRAQAFNAVDSGQNFQVRELADRVGARIPGAKVGFGAQATGDTRNYRVSGDRLKALIGPWCRIGLDQGIDELVSALGAEPVSVEEFEGERFQRLAHLKALIASGALDANLRRPQAVADGPAA